MINTSKFKKMLISKKRIGIAKKLLKQDENTGNLFDCIKIPILQD